MFPEASALSPATRNRCAINAVVVVLPLVPVMAMQRTPCARAARKPRSISETISRPASRAAASGGASGGTPGETTTPAAARIFARSWRPTSTSTPGSVRSASVRMVGGIARVHARTLAGEEPRGGDAAEPQAEHGDDAVPPPPGGGDHRTFNVARAIAAHRKPRM